MKLTDASSFTAPLCLNWALPFTLSKEEFVSDLPLMKRCKQKIHNSMFLFWMGLQAIWLFWFEGVHDVSVNLLFSKVCFMLLKLEPLLNDKVRRAC